MIINTIIASTATAQSVTENIDKEKHVPQI